MTAIATARAQERDLGDIYLRALAGLLVGYAFLGKGFAYFGSRRSLSVRCCSSAAWSCCSAAAASSPPAPRSPTLCCSSWPGGW
ncbi:hypothetical protein ACFQU7_31540 [Pseudoroseomonas wenyumeiae]